MFKEMTVDDFFDLLSSSSPTPGGGAASGISGAQGIALTSMVASLTVGKKKYAEYNELNEKAIEKAAHLKDEFLALADEDAESFDEMSKVLSMSKETEKDILLRKEALQAAFKKCTLPPVKVMEISSEALKLTKSIVGKSNRSASSDLAVAALNLKAASESAWVNVLVNLSYIEDEDFKRQIIEKGRRLKEENVALSLEIYDEVTKEFIK